MIRMAVDAIKRSGRSTQGVIVTRLREGEHVSTLAPVVGSDDDDAELVKTFAKWQQDVMEIPPLPNFPIALEAEASVAYSWGNKKDLDKWLEEKAKSE